MGRPAPSQASPGTRREFPFQRGSTISSLITEGCAGLPFRRGCLRLGRAGHRARQTSATLRDLLRDGRWTTPRVCVSRLQRVVAQRRQGSLRRWASVHPHPHPGPSPCVRRWSPRSCRRGRSHTGACVSVKARVLMTPGEAPHRRGGPRHSAPRGPARPGASVQEPGAARDRAALPQQNAVEAGNIGGEAAATNRQRRTCAVRVEWYHRDRRPE